MNRPAGLFQTWAERATGLLLTAGLLAGCTSERAGDDNASESAPAPTPLVTGRSIEPRFAASQPVGSIPANMVLSSDGKFAISSDVGFRQLLWSIRTADGKGVSHLEYPRLPLERSSGLYYGLAIAGDGTLYVAQGNNDSIAVLKLDDSGTLSRTGTFKTRKGDFPSGLALDDRGRLYVANNDPVSAPGVAFELPGSISIFDASAGKELGRFEFTQSFGGTPNFPLAIAALHDGSKLYVGSERDSAVYVLDVSQPARPRLLSSIPTGSHPIALLLDRAQSRLFVANAHSDTISVVDTRTDRVTRTVLLRPEIAHDVAGATPTGLALSPDERMLYVSLGDMNAVGVVDAEKGELLGYLPAGWYPTAVLATPDGKRLLVSDAKGTDVRHPNPPPSEAHSKSPIALLEGNVLAIDVPSRQQLPALTQRVLELNRLTPRYVRRDNPLAPIGLQAGKIKHVIYIVKENRTYDQVLGDLAQGNGDFSRCIFGREVTPNLHALAERFVLLDNFYDCGEVSGDGWTWSTQGQANEYIVRNVPYSYSDRGRNYDYEGEVNDYPVGGFPAKGPDGKPLSDDPKFRNGAPAVPDVSAAPGGHLWDMVRKARLTYRNYGFFYSGGVTDAKKTIIPENYPSATGLQPGGHDLEGVSDVDFRMFDLNYPDSDARAHFAVQEKDDGYLRPMRSYGKHHAPSRFAEWNVEFQQMLSKAPDGSGVPSFMTIRFMCDHTMGANPKQHTPRSMVTDNDYAIGQFVEAISNGPIWRSTAIFIIEDDAQNGPDHVDAHRSTCYVISPWIKARSVDHHFHNTVSVLRTMELLLGLPPMCQYDATADPIIDWDTRPSNDAPYSAILPDPTILRQLNGETSPKHPVSPEQKAMMDESSRMDFAHADRAPADRLNQIIWQTVKGPGAVMPPTPRGPSPLTPRKIPMKDEDD